MLNLHSLYHSPKAHVYLSEVLAGSEWSGNGGRFHDLCLDYFRKEFSFNHCWLTHSCTSALEIATMLLELGPGDEVILPSFTYVGTATPFVRTGAELVFADSMPDHPGMSIEDCRKKITAATRAIVLVHYGGMAHDPAAWRNLADEHNIILIEDAAHCIDALYDDVPLGKWGHISTFSFHSTKNISCGEGGLLVVNDSAFANRAAIIMDKGTNRQEFLRGKVKGYEWVDVGSSFVLSEVLCSLLWSQLEVLHNVTAARRKIWDEIFHELRSLGNRLPVKHAQCQHNAHIFYLLTDDQQQRDALKEHLARNQVSSAFHYQSLHNSPYNLKHANPKKLEELPGSNRFSRVLLRIPCHGQMNEKDIKTLKNSILSFFK